jgi:hypothetical protein
MSTSMPQVGPTMVEHEHRGAGSSASQSLHLLTAADMSAARRLSDR